MKKSKKWTPLPYVSILKAQRFASILFLLTSAAIWLGIMGAAKEIVTERNIVNREFRIGLTIISYIGSKILYLMTIASIQCLVLSSLVIAILFEDATILTYLSIYGIMLLTSLASITMGLAISSLVNSYRAALTAIPLVMLTQLIFGGLIRPLTLSIHFKINTFSELSQLANHLVSYITIQRWGFEAMLNHHSFPFPEVLNLNTDPSKLSETGLDLFQYLHTTPTPLASVYFTENVSLLFPFWALTIFFLINYTFTHYNVYKRIHK